MRKSAIIGLAIALFLSLLYPTAALAAKPAGFNTSGYLLNINTGDVFAAGESGRFVVVDRQVTGIFTDGDFSGQAFQFNYRANVWLDTQAGNLQGRIQVGDGYLLNVTAMSDGVQIIGLNDDGYLAELTSSGTWAFLDGALGQGNFVNQTTVQLGPDLHVIGIVGSMLTLTGNWQP